MSKLGIAIETLRQKAAKTALENFYEDFEQLTLFGVSVEEVMRRFAETLSEMAENKPFRPNEPGPAAEHQKNYERLSACYRLDAEQRLTDAAGVLVDCGLRRAAIIDKLDEILGPDYFYDEEQEGVPTPTPVKPTTAKCPGESCTSGLPPVNHCYGPCQQDYCRVCIPDTPEDEYDETIGDGLQLCDICRSLVGLE